MNYKKIYTSLIETRKNRGRSKNNGIFERHHILPKCVGGKDTKDNLILLTPREHFLAHWLLVKMYEGKQKSSLSYAFWKMCSCNGNQVRNFNSLKYEIAKRSISQNCSGENHPSYGKKMSVESRKIMSDNQMGITNSMYGKDAWNKGLSKDENEILMGVSNKTKGMSTRGTGWNHSEETKQKISEGHKGKRLSDTTKKKLSDLNKGKKLSDETKKKMSDSRKGKPQKLLTCPHCKKVGGTTMYRWHFDKCKFKEGGERK